MGQLLSGDDLIRKRWKKRILERKIASLKVDGGLHLIIAIHESRTDISDIHIVRHKSIESTSHGAAYLWV